MQAQQSRLFCFTHKYWVNSYCGYRTLSKYATRWDRFSQAANIKNSPSVVETLFSQVFNNPSLNIMFVQILALESGFSNLSHVMTKDTRGMIVSLNSTTKYLLPFSVYTRVSSDQELLLPYLGWCITVITVYFQQNAKICSTALCLKKLFFTFQSLPHA